VCLLTTSMRVRHGGALLVPVLAITLATLIELRLDLKTSKLVESFALQTPNETVGQPSHAFADGLSTAIQVRQSSLTVTSQYPKIDQIDPSRWIHVEEFSEGMATWTRSLVEILLVAKKLNATVVEPCIGMGRLQTCNKANYRLSQVYDLERLRLLHPHIVPFENYINMLAVQKPNIVSMCHQIPGGSPHVMLVCGKHAPNMYQEQRNDLLERALQNNATTVIDIKYYRKGGFAKTTLEGVELISDKMVKAAMSAHLEFQRQHYDTVDQLLKLMGILNDTAFDVIHWRAELPNINHNECATKIFHTKKVFGSNQTVLISSIHTHTFFQWFTPYRQAQAVQSLNRLFDADFHKVEQVYEGQLIPDIVVLAVWDQIMALKARHFATCTKGCHKNTGCRSCNYLGNFAQLAIDLRQNVGKTSDKCWPS
jgi:hypothetical protein